MSTTPIAETEGWSPKMPTGTGAYMVRAENIDPARVEVMRYKPDGALWVQDNQIGTFPLEAYHSNLGGTVEWKQLAKSTYKLKTWPQYWEAVAREEKPFELRKNDRGFKADDMLELYEFEPCPLCKGEGLVDPDTLGERWRVSMAECPTCSGTKGAYTGRMLRVLVSYVLDQHEGLTKGYAILGLGKPFVMAGGRYFPEGTIAPGSPDGPPRAL